MESAPLTSWEKWLEAYQEYHKKPSDGASAACPNCGFRLLNLIYAGYPGSGVGYASFWCSECLTGISISRCQVPTDARFISLGVSLEERAAIIPDYVLVAPE